MWDIDTTFDDIDKANNLFVWNPLAFLEDVAEGDLEED